MEAAIAAAQAAKAARGDAESERERLAREVEALKQQRDGLAAELESVKQERAQLAELTDAVAARLDSAIAQLQALVET